MSSSLCAEANLSKEQEEKQTEKLHRILEKPVYGLICRFAVPTIITMMVSALYNFADTYFVSGMSDAATAAVGIVYSLVCLIQAIGYFWGQGSGNYISRKLGSEDVRDAQNMAEAGFYCSLAVGTAIMFLGWIFLTPLCRLLGAPSDILSETKVYCGIILLGTPFVMASLTLNMQFRFQGNAVSSMLGIALGAVLNVFLDPIMIYNMNMGIRGAAWATVISQAVSFLVLLRQSYMSGNIPIRLRIPTVNFEVIHNICAGGMPSLCRQGLNSVSMTVLNTIAKPYGVAAVAAMAVVSKVMSLCVAFATGFGQGFQPVCGMNYGAKRNDRVLQAYRFTVIVGVTSQTLIATICYMLAPQIIALFNTSEGSGVLEYGVTTLRYQCITFPGTAFLIITNMMVQTMGKMFSGTLLAVARTGLFFIPAVLILSHALGFLGIQLAQPCADICSFLCTVFVWLFTRKELRCNNKNKDKGTHL